MTTRPLFFVLVHERHRLAFDPDVHDMTRSRARAEKTYRELRKLYAPGEAKVWLVKEVSMRKRRPKRKGAGR